MRKRVEQVEMREVWLVRQGLTRSLADAACVQVLKALVPVAKAASIDAVPNNMHDSATMSAIQPLIELAETKYPGRKEPPLGCVPIDVSNPDEIALLLEASPASVSVNLYSDEKMNEELFGMQDNPCIDMGIRVNVAERVTVERSLAEIGVEFREVFQPFTPKKSLLGRLVARLTMPR